MCQVQPCHSYIGFAVSINSSHFFHLSPRVSFPELQLHAQEGGLISSCVQPLLLWWLMLFLWLLHSLCGEVSAQETACRLCFTLQRDADVSGGTWDKARGQGRRWHDRARLFFAWGGRGVTFSSNALGCVVVNWGNNSLLNKT